MTMKYTQLPKAYLLGSEMKIHNKIPTLGEDLYPNSSTRKVSTSQTISKMVTLTQNEHQIKHFYLRHITFV